MNEIFKDIPNYEGIYQVSNLGNVKSLHYGKEKILKPYKGVCGYKYFIATNKQKRKTIKVHQAVAMAFLNHKPCGCKLVVNHKDFNKTNNEVANLEIVTTRENSNRKHLKSSSKYVGVRFCKKSNKWNSRIIFNKKRISLGFFNTEIEANQYYINALKSIKKNENIIVKRKKVTSIYNNIFFDKTRNKWVAKAFINNKVKNLGRFNTELEAYNFQKNYLNSCEVPKVSENIRKSSLSISF